MFNLIQQDPVKTVKKCGINPINALSYFNVNASLILLITLD